MENIQILCASLWLLFGQGSYGWGMSAVCGVTCKHKALQFWKELLFPYSLAWPGVLGTLLTQKPKSGKEYGGVCPRAPSLVL